MAMSTVMIFQVSIMRPVTGMPISVVAKAVSMVAAIAVGITHRNRWLMICVAVMNQRADCDGRTDTDGHAFAAVLLFGACPCR
jgi:hypothetical protein